MKKNITTDDFIASARLIHGDKYDYSRSVYSKAIEKVKIICPIHGEFSQTPNHHVRGHGCSRCGREKVTQLRTQTKDYFVEKALKVHGGKYDYSLVEYKRAKDKVDIICPLHGVFRQEAFSHLNGCGCPVCGASRQVKKRTKSSHDFIAQSIKIHGEKYDYSSTKYTGAFNKVSIVCPVHGVFEQIPHNHIKGVGCPGCATFGFDLTRSGILYLLRFEKSYCSFWKIGITNKTVKRRFGSDAKYISFQKEWYFDEGRQAFELEQKTIKAFNDYRLNIFLFPLLNRGGDTECFDNSLPFKKVILFIQKETHA